ncbi:apoptosis-antagonizing transcription factor [Crepidotus variabilis]|uniref:Protein BFR2 n=1 Tax=Crepidotus variabilis TaxID=179855 RepID=A0A9P6EB54_9AGAR|nr:apoptosis-antagonizing transcription factor [Crepidotus variabilis]
MASGRLSLAEQIAQLEEAVPIDHDPEDVQSRDPETAENSQTASSLARTHYIDVGPSVLRNALSSVADPKYEGVRTSRKDLFNDGELSEAEDEDIPEESDYNDEDTRQQDKDESPDETESQSAQISDQPLDEEEPDLSSKKRKTTDDEAANETVLPLSLRQAREGDIRKGQAIKRQLTLWDTLLDTRIRLQKAVVSANTLPPPSHIQPYLEAAECQDVISKFLDEAIRLTDELDDLQENLLQSNKVIPPPPQKRRKLGEAASISEYSEALRTATEDAVTLEESLHPYVLQTLSKWSAKIEAVAPSALISSNRGAFLKGNQQPKSAVQLVDEFLADNTKILERTRTSRVKGSRIGVAPTAAETGEPDSEIFDDTDFYQKMLRDIIDSRKDGNRNEDWMLLQKQKKAKKTVDTKASKGRKLRFEVHEKLQNFMVPVPVSGAWHDEQIDELFSSLLGKGFENIPLNRQEPQSQDLELSGFRVFG